MEKHNLLRRLARRPSTPVLLKRLINSLIYRLIDSPIYRLINSLIYRRHINSGRLARRPTGGVTDGKVLYFPPTEAL